MRWQQRARIGIAIFGIAFAGIVFFAIGERERPTAAPAPDRIDPTALVETAQGSMNRVTGTRQDFVVTFDHQLAYENGESRLAGVRIEVKERQGRDFVITGAEALANEKAREIELSGDVRMLASDGFELSTATATFREHDGVVRTPGAVSFKKGPMSGTGLGMTYDKTTDVLTIAEEARVSMVDAAGRVTGEFTAGTATLARLQNVLVLDRDVHALRGEQTIDADHVTAHLTEHDDALTAIQLRGNARVAGGSTAFDSMSARDIDIEYAGDGTTIERVGLTGQGTIALKGRQGGPGRRMLGESLTLALAPDGSVTSAVGRDGVQLDLPGGAETAARRVRARTLEASGEEGRGMTSVRFTGEVEYREDAAAGAAPRTARSETLAAELDGDAISAAVFSGRVRFEEKELAASAAEARYEPAQGVLRLKGADEGGGPRVADEQVAIEANAIDVTLEGRTMLADGNVKTRLQGTPTTPGLLQKEQPANVSAARLRYEGDPGRAVYTGGAQLWQGDTAIRGDTITIDREKGHLSALGAARSTLMLGADTSVGRAEAIRYDDGSRQIAYVGATPPPAVVSATPASRTAAAATPLDRPSERGAPRTSSVPSAPASAAAQLSGPQGDLTARRIVVVLAKDERRMERLEAYDEVDLRVDQRTATGTRLTYFAGEGRYAMAGAGVVPVTVTEACRQTTGRTLTFFKATDNIIVDGNEESRTRTTSSGPCPEPPR